MLERLTDFLIKRRMKQLHIPVATDAALPSDEFKRVLNTLRENNG